MKWPLLTFLLICAFEILLLTVLGVKELLTSPWVRIPPTVRPSFCRLVTPGHQTRARCL